MFRILYHVDIINVNIQLSDRNVAIASTEHLQLRRGFKLEKKIKDTNLEVEFDGAATLTFNG